MTTIKNAYIYMLALCIASSTLLGICSLDVAIEKTNHIIEVFANKETIDEERSFDFPDMLFTHANIDIKIFSKYATYTSSLIPFHVIASITLPIRGSPSA